jgi:hypothetical protein
MNNTSKENQYDSNSIPPELHDSLLLSKINKYNVSKQRYVAEHSAISFLSRTSKFIFLLPLLLLAVSFILYCQFATFISTTNFLKGLLIYVSLIAYALIMNILFDILLSKRESTNSLVPIKIMLISILAVWGNTRSILSYGPSLLDQILTQTIIGLALFSLFVSVRACIKAALSMHKDNQTEKILEKKMAINSSDILVHLKENKDETLKNENESFKLVLNKFRALMRLVLNQNCLSNYLKGIKNTYVRPIETSIKSNNYEKIRIQLAALLKIHINYLKRMMPRKIYCLYREQISILSEEYELSKNMTLNLGSFICQDNKLSAFKLLLSDTYLKDILPLDVEDSDDYKSWNLARRLRKA